MRMGNGAAMAAAILLGAAAPAATIDLGAAKDNSMYEGGFDVSNGAGQHFFAGRNNGGDRRRALIAFNVGGSIPPGSTITSVTLTLYMSRTGTGNRVVSLYRALQDWGEGTSDAGGEEGGGAGATEGDATWNLRFFNAGDPGASPPWITPGGDYVPAASASTTVGGVAYYTWSSPAMTQDVQGWVDGPASDYGWVVVGVESSSHTAKRFDSRQNPIASRRPVLTVTYDPPVDAGACCFGDGSCLDLLDGGCVSAGGVFHGSETECATTMCPQPPTGACCSGGGTCAVMTQFDCLAIDGAFQGGGTGCSPDPCIALAGACCFDGGTCQVLIDTACNAAGGTFQGPGISCVPGLCPLMLEHFVDPLPIPPVAQPNPPGMPGGQGTYDIAMREVSLQLHRDLPPTRLWTYAGLYPGPTIEATTGLPVVVNWRNDLRDEQGALRTTHYFTVDECPHGADQLPRTVVHLHGGHVPAPFDGHPELTILPGQVTSYLYPNQQLPATLWYHDHALGTTRLNVYLGLAGFYLIRDAYEVSLNLPAGEDEIPLVIQDRTFNPDGTLYYPEVWQDHFFGDTIVVNGKVWPYLEVKQGKYRFRVLNGSNGRTYTLTLVPSGGGLHPFTQIGTDGGLLPAPLPVTEITLAPAERADLVVDFAGLAPGTEIVMTNSAPAPYPGTPGVGIVPDVMKFIVLGEVGHTAPLPFTLRPVEVLQESSAAVERPFVLRRAMQGQPPCAAPWLINGLMWNDITELPRLGETEIWNFQNPSGLMHPMHMHLILFQVLDRQAIEVVDDEIVPVGDPVPPDPTEQGWKDTVRVGPGTQARVIARFTDYTGLFPYHCHILEHEDHEMMRQFQTLPACPADFDHTDDVGFGDLLAVLGAWGPCGDPCFEDLDDDGMVGFSDVLVLLGAWGPCPM